MYIDYMHLSNVYVFRCNMTVLQVYSRNISKHKKQLIINMLLIIHIDFVYIHSISYNKIMGHNFRELFKLYLQNIWAEVASSW